MSNNTTIGIKTETRDVLKDHKIIPSEPYNDVIMRTFEENDHLKVELEEFRKELELCHLECEGLKGALAGKELNKTYSEAK